MDDSHSQTRSQSSPSSTVADMKSTSCSESLTSLNDGSNADLAYPSLEIDGHEIDPIVVCGFSMKFPQDATSSEGLWELMMERKCAMTEFPPERLNVQGFHNKSNRLNTLPVRGGHFIKDDLSVFDANFFSLAPTEATSIDPMQRWLLEEAYRALENAGIPMEHVSGSRTAVYTGSFGFDYMLQLCRDPENPPMYAALGFGISMLANRLSWFFNLQGPSIGLDSACSSTAMAVDMACKSLHDRSCDMAMVAGCNIANSPESYLWMSNIGFLSPDSRCHSFDHRANGYARGEGVGVVLLKRLSDAIIDGNTIRAVIRSTASNEDGQTQGITQPSRVAQERLIRETYKKAGLSMAHTRFFEAHGTGTAIGDPREAQAIGSVFRKYRSTADPIHVGALKSNIGHLEGASGLAALIKTILVLERGIVPPNANFEKLNPKIDAEFLKLNFPTEARPWPITGLRRASINSFGYGGANSHIVVDDAYNYLRLRSLRGKHSTSPYPPAISAGHDFVSTLLPETDILRAEGPSKLLVWSSADKEGVSRTIDLVQDWYSSTGSHDSRKRGTLMDDLAHTLSNHRSQLQWRSFALANCPAELSTLDSRISSPIRAHSNKPRLGYVFSGQGAQWFAMGRELMSYSTFNAELDGAEKYLSSLGCYWSVKDELLKTKDASNIDSPELSQTLCTVLQVAIVNLLRSFNVMPSAVVGHSSGEIAAAYAGGYISRESAWKLAYYRGICSVELAEGPDSKGQGAMMSVGLSEDEAKVVVAAANQDASTFGLSIACINSPKNVTLAGETRLIDRLQAELEQRKVFARKLRVPVAYHSGQMKAISIKYKTMIGSLSEPLYVASLVPMISSVTGERALQRQLTDPTYWALNMTSPVQFIQAVAKMCEHCGTDVIKKIDRSHLLTPVVNHLVEVGPHAALQGPLREILRATPRTMSVDYNSILHRGHSAVQTTLNTLGELHCMGYPVNLTTINKQSEDVYSKVSPSLLVDLPGYPFDHAQHYWEESRLSRNYRLRAHAPSQLVGVRSNDWNASEARWRHFIHAAEIPWAAQHVINGTVLYPGAGMLVMAIEAARQLVGELHAINSYTLRDVSIDGPMNLGSNTGGLEVQTYLHELQSRNINEKAFEFAVRTWSDNDWILNCRGSIFVELSGTSDQWTEKKNAAQRRTIAKNLESLTSHCEKAVDSQHMYRFLAQNGYEYGPMYQAVQQQRYNDTAKQAMAEVELFNPVEDHHVVHPVSLDAILHLAFTAKTAGGSRPMATSIPARIGCIWVSDQGLSWPEQSTVTAYTTVRSITKRGFACAGGVLGNDATRELRLWYDDFELVNITSEPSLVALLPNPKQFCMTVERKVALDKLSNSEIFTFIRNSCPVKQDLSSFYRDVRQLVEMSLERLVKSIDATTFGSQEPWRNQYWRWAQYHLEQSRQAPRRDELSSLAPKAARTIEDLSKTIANASRLGRLYAEVASNLIAIFRGEANPLDILLTSGLLRDGYADWTGYDCAKQAATYMDLLAHQVPGLNILEVGGGTAATTRNLIGTLRSGTDESVQSLRCNRYDFTDVSPSFLEKARQEFATYHSQMTFGTLNIERDFAEQGFSGGFYDVVAADNVLHVSSNLGKTLRNVRKALKPGGKLIMQELVRPTGWTSGFIFGVLPGWWLGVEDSRTLSPNLAPSEWDTVLKSNGFSGVDMIFRDFDDDVAHQIGWLVATAAEDETTTSLLVQLPRKQQAIIVIDNDSERQKSLSYGLFPPLEELTGLTPCICDLATAIADRKIEENALVILLVDYGDSFIGSLDDTTWSLISLLVQRSRHLLWVSAGGGRGASPDHGLLDGLARTLRSENHELHLVTVALDLAGTMNSKATHLMKIAREMLLRAAHQTYEQDYTEIDGLLHTRRLKEASHIKSAMDLRLAQYRTTSTPLDGKVRFQVSTTSSPDSDSTPHYIELPKSLQESATGDTVEILIRAVSVQPRGRSVALEQGEHSAYGSYCSGSVLSAGMDSAFEPGDNVLAIQNGPLGSHVRVPSQFVVKLPADLSFTDACSTIPSVVTAYHALVEVGRVNPEQSVLIHDGASPVGQAAIRLLAGRGLTNVWATAADEQVKGLISKSQGLSDERILPKDWFDSHSMLSYQWKRSFDIVLNQTTDSVPLVLDYVKSGGRAIAIDSTMTSKSSSLLQPVPENICVSTIHVGIATPEALAHAASLPSGVLMSLKNEPRILPASDLANPVFGSHNPYEHEPIIVEFDHNDAVDVRSYGHPEHNVDSSATYVIAGGFGGLGRAVARWLVGHGARYLILLSRSGPRTAEALELLSELADEDVRVEAPCCDISNRTLLKSVLSNYTDSMPPIKGCIQSTMVMTELVFHKLQFQDWKRTVDPKVRGSWNLHAELPEGLDFFILFSSIMGILGTGSLAAYNAGNTYEDSLAQYRISQGERAIAIDLGGIPDAGYFIDHADQLDSIRRIEKHVLVYVKEVYALLDIFCNQDNPLASNLTDSQAIVGVRPPSHWKHLEDVPFTMAQPFWGHMHHVSPLGSLEEDGDVAGTIQREKVVDITEKLVAAGSQVEATEIVRVALTRHVSALLGTPEDRLDEQKPMHSFGIDSLSAIDIRSWVGKVFDVDIPIFDILEGATFGSASRAIAYKARLNYEQCL